MICTISKFTFSKKSLNKYFLVSPVLKINFIKGIFKNGAWIFHQKEVVYTSIKKSLVVH